MLVPGAPRESVIVGQFAFALDQLLVQSAQRLGLAVAQSCLLVRKRLPIVLCAASQRFCRILHRREVQMRRNFFSRWCDRGAPRIERCLEDAFVQFLVALANFFLLVRQQLLQILGVFLDRVREIHEIKGQDFGVGQAHHRGSDRLGQGAAVDEIIVGKMHVPVEVVVDRVIDALFVLASITQVESSDADVIEKAGEVGAGAERADAQIGALPQFFAVVGGFRLGNLR